MYNLLLKHVWQVEHAKIRVYFRGYVNHSYNFMMLLSRKEEPINVWYFDGEVKIITLYQT